MKYIWKSNRHHNGYTETKKVKTEDINKVLAIKSHF